MYKDTDRQGPLFDVKSSLSESARRRLERSWAHGFAQDVYPILLEVESQFAELYGSVGRPNWSVARMLGVCLLQEMLDLNDQQAVDALVFDERWRYALGFGADADSYLSRQGLVEFRSRLVRYDPESELLGAVFERLTEGAITDLDISTQRQRIDSTLIKSNIRERGRLDLLLTTLRGALKAVTKTSPEAMALLSRSLREWYEDKERGRGWFGDGGIRLGIEQAGEWLFEVMTQFGEDDELARLEEVQLARRALLENFDFDPEPDPGGGSRPRLTTKKHSVRVEHPSTLQSPHDPDAGKGHKGRGYLLQLVETCENESCELITAFSLHPANEVDQDKATVLIEALAQRDRQPGVLFADAGYTTPIALEAAQTLGTYLHGPMPRRVSQQGLDRCDFVFSVRGHVEKCPEGHPPIDHRERQYESTDERHLHAFFDLETCQNCSNKDQCPVMVRQHEAVLPLVPRLYLRAQRWREQTQDAWWKAYSIRSGVEATFSELKRAHGCAKLRVRTRARVKAALTLKLTACNVKRWLRAARPRHKSGLQARTRRLTARKTTLRARVRKSETWKRKAGIGSRESENKGQTNWSRIRSRFA